MTSLQICGGGKMGEALLGGILSSGFIEPGAVSVVEKLPERREELKRRFPGVTVLAEVDACESALLAVKPNDVAAACRSLGACRPARVLSVAAGITTRQLESWLSDGSWRAHVVRSMPNTPALVGAGIAAIAPGLHADGSDLEWAEQVLGAVGEVVRVTEAQLDAVTGLSGSGPAYIFLVAEALAEAGVLAGLARSVAEQLAAHTVAGAGVLLTTSGRSAGDLRADVTSPGGTTAAGLRALEAAAVRSAFIEAVLAATARSEELGRS